MPMLLRSVAVLAALMLLGSVGLPAQDETFPVDDLRPGMVGVGRTVFEGDRLEDFTVHIIGVLRNVIGPRRDLILARLEGGPLANTGVIAGMSGSPVYIDGRLIGAVAYALGTFSKEPIAGITPIAEITDSVTFGGSVRPPGSRIQIDLPLTPPGHGGSARVDPQRLRSAHVSASIVSSRYVPRSLKISWGVRMPACIADQAMNGLIDEPT